MNNVKIIGAGMTKFVKPGSQLPYRIMASNAVESALKDADIDKKHIQQVFASYIYGDSTCGQHAFYDVAQLGVPRGEILGPPARGERRAPGPAGLQGPGGQRRGVRRVERGGAPGG